jgi:hypothetical protein
MARTTFSTSTALALAAVLLSSSTTIYAVAKLPKHSVGAPQLKTSAVTNNKIAKHAVTGSKVSPNTLGGSQIKESSLGQVPSATNAGFANTAGNSARLEGKGSANFVGAPRMAFGKGSAISVPATTVLSLPNVGVTVTTDGEADALPEVEVNLPMESSPAPDWYVSASNANTYSTYGGTAEFGPTAPNHDVTVHIWRNSSTQGIYLHCTFDTTGFSSAHPLSCWALST